MLFIVLLSLACSLLAIVSAGSSGGVGNTPFVPHEGWTYYLEAVRPEAWPSCSYRFLSYDSTCNSVDMYNAVGVNQEWTLVKASSDTYYLRSSCGSYLSYTDNCDSPYLDQWPEAGVNQEFRFVVDDNTQFQYYLQAVGRGGCEYAFATCPQGCTSSSPDSISLSNNAGRFRLFPVRSESPKVWQANSGACADPFVFYSKGDSQYHLQCTGGDIALSSSNTIGLDSSFTYNGVSLGGSKPAWAADGARWAPESFFYNENTSYLLFSDTQQDGVHRIGWSKSSSGVHTAAWDVYAGDYLGLSGSSGGEIDQNVFYDPDTGKSFLLWKSDDNNVGDTVTRIWMSEISVTADGISVVSSPEVILDSTGLWWIDSWIDNGSLIEGPELIKPEGSSFYYLFFASGKYCQDSYAEGVARSQNLWGPYEKMGVPLLSTGAVGNGMANSNTDKLIGPGHGSLQNDLATGELYMMWHASVGHNCDRYPFTTRILFGEDEWPYAELV